MTATVCDAAAASLRCPLSLDGGGGRLDPGQAVRSGQPERRVL